MKIKKLITLLSLTFLLAGPLLAQLGKPLYTFPFGVQTFTYRNSFPNGVAETLDTIKSLGVTEIETGVPKGLTLEEYKKMLDERNLKVPSTGARYEDLAKDPTPAIQQAKVFGAEFVMVSWIPHDGKFNIEHAKKAVEDFNKAGKVLKENGLKLAYHAHGYEFTPYEKGTLFDYIAKNTNPEYVSFEMDIFWVFHGGADPVQLLKKYGNRWKLMHLKDLKKGVQGNDSGATSTENCVALGEGQINIPAVLKEAKKAGIKHYFIEDESSRIRTQVPQTIAYIKSLKE
jgi:sugar phosphate isomerase/epimerase